MANKGGEGGYSMSVELCWCGEARGFGCPHSDSETRAELEAEIDRLKVCLSTAWSDVERLRQYEWMWNNWR